MEVPEGRDPKGRSLPVKPSSLKRVPVGRVMDGPKDRRGEESAHHALHAVTLSEAEGSLHEKRKDLPLKPSSLKKVPVGRMMRPLFTLFLWKGEGLKGGG